MSTLSSPVSKETLIFVLRELAKKRQNITVTNSHHSPEELIVIQDDVTIVYCLPDDVDVPEHILKNIAREYGIPLVFFLYPEALTMRFTQ